MMRYRVYSARYVSNTSKVKISWSDQSCKDGEDGDHIGGKIPTSIDAARDLALEFADSLKKSQIISICERSLLAKEGASGLEVTVYYSER